jgi:hypothetical protein
VTITPPTFVAARRQTANTWSTQASTTKTTASFSVSAGDNLVVLAGCEGGTNAFSGIAGGSLTWAPQETAGTTGSTAKGAIYSATVDADKSMTVSLTINDALAYWGFVVHQYRGSDGIGAHTNQANTVSGVAPSQDLVTGGDNSAISYLDTDWTATDGTTRTWRTINSITPTAGNGLETDYFRDSGGTQYAVYAGYWSDVGATGSKTTGLSTPTQRPAIVAIEIKGSAGPPLPFDPTYTDWPLRQPHPKMRGAA